MIPDAAATRSLFWHSERRLDGNAEPAAFEELWRRAAAVANGVTTPDGTPVDAADWPFETTTPIAWSPWPQSCADRDAADDKPPAALMPRVDVWSGTATLSSPCPDIDDIDITGVPALRVDVDGPFVAENLGRDLLVAFEQVAVPGVWSTIVSRPNACDPPPVSAPWDFLRWVGLATECLCPSVGPVAATSTLGTADLGGLAPLTVAWRARDRVVVPDPTHNVTVAIDEIDMIVTWSHGGNA